MCQEEAVLGEEGIENGTVCFELGMEESSECLVVTTLYCPFEI